ALVQFEPYWPAAVLLAGLQTILFISGNVIQPRKQGDNQNIDPVVVLLSPAQWGKPWGVAGMVVPTTLAVMSTANPDEVTGARWRAILLSGDGDPYADEDEPAPTRKRGAASPRRSTEAAERVPRP